MDGYGPHHSQGVETIIKMLDDLLRQELRQRAQQPNFDLLEVLYDTIVEIQEEVITRLYPDLLAIDASFLEDPNVIANQMYPTIIRSTAPKTHGNIVSADLQFRSPFTDEEIRLLEQGCVGFAGFGGVQFASIALARSGVLRFVLVDPDVFEASNANRQMFCDSDVLGLSKVGVGREGLLKINSDIQVLAHQESITADNVDNLFAPADIIIVATGDVVSRNIVNDYAQRTGKPVLNSGIAGWEAQYLTLMPEDPRYGDIFDYGIYAVGRGITPVVISIVDLYLAIDTLKILLGRADTVIRYPKLLTVNLFRKNPVVMRDVTKIRERNKLRHSGTRSSSPI